MYRKINIAKMDGKAFSYIMWSLVLIEFILSLQRRLVFAVNFGQFDRQKTALKPRFQIFANF